MFFLGALLTPAGNNWIDAFQQLSTGGGWPLDNNSLILQITNSGLKEKLVAAANAEEVDLINDQIFFANLARAVLLLLFAGITFLVYLAYRKRKKMKQYEY